jgi:outer membrane lipoprotein-sorting protein
MTFPEGKKLKENKMKNIWKGIGLAIVLSLVVGHVQAQYDAEAKKILDKMSAKYKSIPSFTASITYSLDNDEDDIHDSFSGTIGIKGEKFRMFATEQEIIINDGTVWTFLAEENEVNIDSYSPDEEDVTPSNIYSIYQDGYKYMLFGEETIKGKVYQVVDLSPEDVDGDYFRIRLYIGKSDSILKKFTMYAKSGNRYTYELSDFNPKAALKDDYFVFDASQYEEVEVIDLRMDN